MTPEYLRYLKSPQWAAIRRAVKLRAGHRCERCNRGGCELNVHHLDYSFIFREHLAMHTLVCLCRQCHALAHGRPVIRRWYRCAG